MNVIVGDEPQERRLFQLHRKALSQRLIEHYVPGAINEIAKNNRGFWSQTPHWK